MPMDTLDVHLDDTGILAIIMDRPPANAVDVPMYIRIAEVFAGIARSQDDIRVVILSGRGRHFCAGNDLDEFATMNPENATERMWHVREAFFAIMGCAVPVIGAVHGSALGTGLALAASCDFVVAGAGASFGLPELTVGVMGGARHLTRLAPQPLVRRMYFTGQPLSAAAFQAAGGAVMVCDDDDLMATAHSLAARIAAHSPTAVRVSKRVLDRIEWMDVREGYRFEQAATERMSGHPDAKEALSAFRERRAPQYQARSDDHRWFGD